MFKGGFKCNLKGYPHQNYLEYMQRIIDSDQTLKDIMNDFQGQFEEFKIYLKSKIFNDPGELQQLLTNVYNQWDTQFKVVLKRIDIFRLIMLMYLGLLERNFSQGGFYIIDMSSIKNANNYISKQKLKCFKVYIKSYYLNSDKIQDEILIFSKNSVNKEDYRKKFEQSNNQSIDFEFTKLKNEDHQNSTVVDFADQNIGGLVLDTRNCAQEEIVMLIFPEAIVSMIFIPQMEETEAVLIENLKKYSTYTGYEQSFQCSPSLDLQGNYNMLAIDAKPFYSENQFTEENIYRELVKCYAGFELSLKNQPGCYISTGRWGCGIFRGNPYLKTLIQFLSFGIAVSQVNQQKQKIIINCVNDQSLFNFGAKLTNLLGQKGVQLNLINLKKSILYLQNGVSEQRFYNQGDNVISQIYAILTQDIEQIQELRQENDNVIQAQVNQNIKQEKPINAPIIEEIREFQIQNNQEKKITNHFGIGIAIAISIVIGVFVYKKVSK